MCGRFMLDGNMEKILQQYRIIKYEVDNYKKGDIYPSENTPIIVHDKGRTLKSAKWGFPLNGKSKLVINARIESISNKSMFKDIFDSSRCIIPASLFYEWKDEGDNNKVKYEIYLEDKGIISLGGLYKFTLNENGQKELSFVIITRESNNHIKDIHNRMPLIIEDDNLDYWLHNNTSKTIIEEIIKSNVSHELNIEKNNKVQPFEQMRMF